MRGTLLPFLLIALCPFAVVLLWYACQSWDGALTHAAARASLSRMLLEWPWPTRSSVSIVLGFAAWQALLMVALPGKRVLGPVTPAGARVQYKVNGLLAWALTHLALYVACFRLEWFSPTIVYDHFGSIIMTCNLFALVFCAFLYLKGVYSPSGRDAGRSGNPVFDFFWGTELHPRLFDFELKQFANCRFGMMSWTIIILSFLFKQRALYGHVSTSMLVSVALQVIYVVKFFWWEDGYLASLDMMHDRFGFYICWGVMTWLPAVYTSQALYLVRHPIALGPFVTIALLVAGVIAIYVNYDADAQRQRVRRTNGATTVWGRAPKLIVAEHRTADGQVKQSLLLASGWWKISRHFHYLAELAAALAWTLPCGFHHYLPYFYVTFLTILLFDRALRDDRRCSAKYGRHWQEYCRLVPHRIIPRVF
ncbi:MAG TPA: 7-dehydrocholesterol reductase [Polyangia bacterium]|nr:7-dehydrocholesterol reductase [Polyangia bacterium]